MLTKRKKLASTLILTLLSMGVVTLQVGDCLPSTEYVYGDTAVYSSNGRGLNVTITADPPENKVHNSTVSFTLKILEPYLRGGSNLVNPNDYFLNVKTLDAYLTSGIILDYDRAKIIAPLWIYWAQTRNATYVAEERALFLNSHDVVFSKSNNTYFGSSVFPELSEGLHNLTIWVRAEFNQVTTYDPLWAAISKTISFTVDTVAPNVTLLTPKNATYNESKISLNFTLNEPFSELAYCLDGQGNVTINGNTTLTGLANGDHNVTIYSTDEFGNAGASETVYFSVEVPFPTTLIIASAIGVIFVGIGLLVYFKKRKR